MFRVFGLATLLAALALCLTTTGAGGQDEKKAKKKYDAETEFKKLDKNKDGKLTREEFQAMADLARTSGGWVNASRRCSLAWPDPSRLALALSKRPGTTATPCLSAA